MNTLYRSGLSVLIALLPVSALSQSGDNRQASTAAHIGSGEVISTARIADPNELVGINGQIVKMSDLTALLSSLDSVEGQNLRIPATHNDETSSPTLPRPNSNSKCPARSAVEKQEGRADPCPTIQSAHPAPDAKHQQD